LTVVSPKNDFVAASASAIEQDFPYDTGAAADESATAPATRLRFAVDAEGRTYLNSCFATYPHHLTRSLYIDRAAPRAATVYLQSLSGGLTQNDRVSLRICTTDAAIAHVTTQAATKVHSMERGFALQQVHLEALGQSHLEYVADPTICFPRSRLTSRTDLCVAEDASAILSDAFMWHDPRGTQQIAFDTLVMETAIRRPNGSLLALDRSRLTTARAPLDNPALLGPYRAFSTLFAVGRGAASEAALTAVRAALVPLPGIYAGVSRLPAEIGLWLRILAMDGAALRTAMDRAWRTCHEVMLGWACDRRRK